MILGRVNKPSSDEEASVVDSFYQVGPLFVSEHSFMFQSVLTYVLSVTPSKHNFHNLQLLPKGRIHVASLVPSPAIIWDSAQEEKEQEETRVSS